MGRTEPQPTGESPSSAPPPPSHRREPHPTGESPSSQDRAPAHRREPQFSPSSPVPQERAPSQRLFPSPTGESPVPQERAPDQRLFPSPTGESPVPQERAPDQRLFPSPTGESPVPQERAPDQRSLHQLQDKQGQTTGHNPKLQDPRRRKRDALANKPGKPGGERERMRRCEGAEVGERGSRLDSLVRSVEEERDFYKQEAERLRRMMMKPSHSTNGPRGPRTSSPSRQPTSKGGRNDPEQKRLQRERDDLQALLNKYELHLSEIQANVKVLSADRDKTSVQYQRAQEEIAHLRRELMKSKLPRAQKSSLTPQNILKRVESERDEAASDLKRMTTERDSLRERLKISRETAISERAHLEQRVEDLQTAMYTLEQDHGDLQSKLAAMKKTVMDLEEALSSQGRKLAAADGELKHSRKEYNALRMAHNQLEAALDDSQLRLTARYSELLTSQEKSKQLEDRNDALLQQIRSLHDEITGLQSTVSELDQRKNDLQEALERECDLLASATDQLNKKEKLVRSNEIRVEELESSSGCLQEKVSRQERELATLRRNLDDFEKELAALTQIKDGALKENSLLREELEKARLDHQVLRELDACRSEAELLRKQLANERLSMKSLESMLQSTREKELRSALSTQEQRAEIQLLRDKLTAADSRTCAQDRKLAQLRIHTEQLESDLALTRRQLSAERLQREWAVPELRLHGLATSARSGSPPHRPLSPRLSRSPDRIFHSSPERRATENAM